LILAFGVASGNRTTAGNDLSSRRVV